MENELPHIDEFDRYESGQMALPEVEIFRKRLLTDQELAREHALYLTLSNGIRSFHRQRLKRLFVNFETSKNFGGEKEYTAKTNGTWRWMVAASVILLMGAGVLLWQFNSRSLTWDQAFIEEPGLPVLMSKQTTSLQHYTASMNAYRQGDFGKALTSLPENNSDTVAFYKGLFALKLNQTDSALENLNRVRQEPQSEFKFKADFYVAMAYWKAGEPEKAKTVFQKISANPDHAFHDQARKILQDSNL